MYVAVGGEHKVGTNNECGHGGSKRRHVALRCN
jgi:hypothetical protein